MAKRTWEWLLQKQQIGRLVLFSVEKMFEEEMSDKILSGMDKIGNY